MLNGMDSEPWYERAKRRMKQMGITQDDLKAPLSVETRGAVGHYLTGRRDPTPDQLAALAKALKISLDELLLETPMAAEPTPKYVLRDEELLTDCMRAVRTELHAMGYPDTDPIWDEKNFTELVVFAYTRAIEKKGSIDAGGLRERIKTKAANFS